MALPESILTRLAGVWRGEGAGSYPDVTPFRYLEECTIVVEPEWSMAHVVQRTWREEQGAKGKALHLEVGLIRITSSGALEYGCPKTFE